ncbi:hypothetical protein ACQPXH_28815 [Nocardia sp. CA-135953]|uniref:hypothetical protein n=1 Tax=Nocardia sp. CA-135953 TaxID=3239978 RepID=UPI003D9A0966
MILLLEGRGLLFDYTSKLAHPADMKIHYTVQRLEGLLDANSRRRIRQFVPRMIATVFRDWRLTSDGVRVNPHISCQLTHPHWVDLEHGITTPSISLAAPRKSRTTDAFTGCVRGPLPLASPRGRILVEFCIDTFGLSLSISIRDPMLIRDQQLEPPSTSFQRIRLDVQSRDCAASIGFDIHTAIRRSRVSAHLGDRSVQSFEVRCPTLGMLVHCSPTPIDTRLHLGRTAELYRSQVHSDKPVGTGSACLLTGVATSRPGHPLFNSGVDVVEGQSTSGDGHLRQSAVTVG